MTSTTKPTKPTKPTKKTKKTTMAVSAATALAALGIGLSAPAMAGPGVGAVSVPATSVLTQHGGAPLDCSVHVLYQGADVDVNWC